MCYNKFASGGGRCCLKKIMAKNTVTNHECFVKDEILKHLLEIHSNYKYYIEEENFTTLFIPVEEDEKDGHIYLIEDKYYTTLITNSLKELKEMESNLNEIQLSLF